MDNKLVKIRNYNFVPNIYQIDALRKITYTSEAELKAAKSHIGVNLVFSLF